MAELTVTINSRNYGIACDDGQEQRVLELARYIDARVKDIARAGAASNETHLLVLTALMLADEIFDLRGSLEHFGKQLEQTGAQRHEEALIVQAIDQLANRLDGIAERIQKA